MPRGKNPSAGRRRYGPRGRFVLYCALYRRENAQKEEKQVEDARGVLKRVFGYDGFRPGQGEIVGAILAGRDVLAVMPTGAGKSLCYQVPALMLPGVTLVVSPLISLMQDQVRALMAAGVRAAYLNSSLTDSQKALMLRRAAEGQYKIIYVAPERLQMPGFIRFARQQAVSMVTVDEAHCISQWGRDFRPSYMLVRDFVDQLPSRPVVAAFTATATDRVRQDIADQLRLRDPFRLVTGFDRPNLRFETRQLDPDDKHGALLRLLTEAGEDDPAIVYCSTVRQVTMTVDALQRAGFAARPYHGQMDAADRRRYQEEFLYDRVQVMVATNAFGMGIDKPNVRMVVHYNMPRDLESYYQEAGRAGRDGAPARCVLLYAASDVGLARFFIEKEEEDGPLPPEQRHAAAEAARARLEQMTCYATTRRCLRGELLRYFGEQAPVRCGNCSNCLSPWAEGTRRKVQVKAASRAIAPGDEQLLAALYELRRELSRKEKLPAFMVLSDAAAREVCARRPRTMDELLAIEGIGEGRARRYGRAILREVERFG